MLLLRSSYILPLCETMDPVSLAASILTLVGAASTTGSALTRLWGLRGSQDYVVSAINEVGCSEFREQAFLTTE